jgi:hypothetical protein
VSEKQLFHVRLPVLTDARSIRLYRRLQPPTPPTLIKLL